MASTLIRPPAARIAVLAAAAGFAPANVWEPRDLGVLPAAVVRLPTITRVAPDQSESQLGAFDWRLAYQVDLWFELAEPIATQMQAAEMVELFIAQIDADPGLSGQVLDSKVLNATPAFYPEHARPVMAYECRVECLKLVAG